MNFQSIFLIKNFMNSIISSDEKNVNIWINRELQSDESFDL